MKKSMFISDKKAKGLTLALLAFTLLSFYSCFNAGGIKGSGDIITEFRQLGTFNQIELRGQGKLILSQGLPQEVKIEAEDNIVEMMKTEVKNEKLIIDYRKNIRKSEPIKIYITIPDLQEAKVSGAGDIIGKTVFESDELKFEVSGAGDINMEVKCRELNTEISGAGDILLGGKTNEHNCRVQGAGSLQAYDLVTEKTDIRISGAGSANIFVKDKLSVNISGAGSVYYKGDAKVTKEKISGAGSIVKQR